MLPPNRSLWLGFMKLSSDSETRSSEEIDSLCPVGLVRCILTLLSKMCEYFSSFRGSNKISFSSFKISLSMTFNSAFPGRMLFAKDVSNGSISSSSSSWFLVAKKKNYKSVIHFSIFYTYSFSKGFQFLTSSVTSIVDGKTGAEVTIGALDKLSAAKTANSKSSSSSIGSTFLEIVSNSFTILLSESLVSLAWFCGTGGW